MSRSRSRFDLSFGPGHGPVSGVLNAAGAMLGLTMWLYVGGASSLWGVSAGVAMAAAAAGVAAWYAQQSRVIYYRVACWASAGLWSGWVLCGFRGIPVPFTGGFRLLTFLSSPSSPWTWLAVLPLLIGSAALAMVGMSMERAERKRVEEAARILAEEQAKTEEVRAAELAARIPPDEETAIGWRWEPFLRKITRMDGIHVLNIELWDPRTGFTLDCQLPDDGSTVGEVKAHEESLATSAPENDGNGLPEGCGVEVLPNMALGRRNFLVKVTTVSALGAEIPYPDDLSMLTVRNPLVLGVESDWKQAGIDVTYQTTVLVGDTDAGKSNQLNVITAGFARCTDVILVGIDLSGNGRMMREWVRQHYEGNAKQPTFRVVAPTADQARLLCKSLRQIIDGRTADYADEMAAANTDKLIPRPRLPQIQLIVDEFKRLPDDVKEMISDLVETGRGAIVRGTFCALEATSSALPRPVIKNSRNRVGMRMSDEAELMYLFDRSWKSGRIDPASMPWAGSGLYSNGPKRLTKLKGYRIDPSRVAQISLATADYRPELDDLSLARGDTVTLRRLTELGEYEDVTVSGIWTRAWERSYPIMFPAGGNFAMAGAGASTTTASGNPAVIEGTATNMDNTMHDSGSVADGFRQIAAAQANLDNAMADLEAAAASPDGGLAAQEDAGDGDQGAGDGEPLPSAAQLQALFDASSSNVDPRATPPTPPAGPPAETPTATNTQGRVSPRRRSLQIVRERGEQGTGPSDVHRVLVAEGYPTSISTVQGWFKTWLAGQLLDQPDGERQPYVPGPKFPTAL